MVQMRFEMMRSASPGLAGQWSRYLIEYRYTFTTFKASLPEGITIASARRRVILIVFRRHLATNLCGLRGLIIWQWLPA